MPAVRVHGHDHRLEPPRVPAVEDRRPERLHEGARQEAIGRWRRRRSQRLHSPGRCLQKALCGGAPLVERSASNASDLGNRKVHDIHDVSAALRAVVCAAGVQRMSDLDAAIIAKNASKLGITLLGGVLREPQAVALTTTLQQVLTERLHVALAPRAGLMVNCSTLIAVLHRIQHKVPRLHITAEVDDADVLGAHQKPRCQPSALVLVKVLVAPYLELVASPSNHLLKSVRQVVNLVVPTNMHVVPRSGGEVPREVVLLRTVPANMLRMLLRGDLADHPLQSLHTRPQQDDPGVDAAALAPWILRVGLASEEATPADRLPMLLGTVPSD
mmetsp:Transcript_24486/g.70309  ORF Transcript_24486/g.70309 Transcript_24486/m.70309 type:complete len:329 (-) Transcript_24486:369-1355(-)